MTVFLGVAGYVELRRSTTAEVFTSVVNPSDVNAPKDRFSFDFPEGMLLTGDRIEIKATDGGLLTFVDASGWVVNSQQNSGSWYINVDELGGIRLYDNFYNAVNGETPGRINLLVPNRNIPIEVRDVGADARILGKVTSYEFNNSREAVDVTELSDEFRQQHSSLISGSGSIECLFDYRSKVNSINNRSPELASYMHQLLLRQKLGGAFGAKLFIVTPGWGDGAASNDRLWFEFDAVITNAGVALQPENVVRSQFEFVTTGVIAIKAATGSIPGYLVQENTDYLLLEQDPSAKLELEYD
jgi:hypothetical protein